MEVTAQMVKELRTRTGAGIMDCKDALREVEGDLEEAVRHLRENGLAQAAKKAGREASEGQIGALVSDDGRMGVLVEVNCETDFVARTDDFQALLGRVAGHVAKEGPDGVAGGADAGPLREAVSEAISKLGENILIARADRYGLEDGEAGRVGSYIHPGGRIGVFVALKCDSEDVAQSPALGDVARDLAMHVAASRPIHLRADLVPKAVIEAEREILLAQQKDSGKPENILAKIVDGRIKKYLREVCLLDQPYVKDPDLTIGKMLAERGKELGEDISVSHFLRFQLGEGSEAGDGE